MNLTADEIKAEIAAGAITAISLDTSIFDASGNRLEHGALARLKQFKGSEIRCLLTDVVVGEVKSHILRDAKVAESETRKAFRGVGKAWQTSPAKRDEVLNTLFGGETPEQLTERRVQDFLGITAIEVIASADFVNVADLLKAYFDAQAPFGTNLSKKSEFPDAIALHALEKWAASRGTKALVVTKDGDWKAYSEKSDSLVAIDELSDALSYFHQDSSVVCSALSDLVGRGFPALKVEILRAFERAIDSITFVPEANSGYFFESDVESVAVTGVDFVPLDDGDHILFKPVERDENYLVVEATVNVSIQVTSSFAFSITDPVDRDEVPMGSTTGTQDLEIEAKAFITFEGDLALKPLVAEVEVEFASTYQWVDFGALGPDWHEERD